MACSKRVLNKISADCDAVIQSAPREASFPCESQAQIRYVISELKSRSKSTRLAAIKSLGNRANHNELPHNWIEVRSSLDRAIPVLLKTVKRGDSDIRYMSALALGDISWRSNHSLDVASELQGRLSKEKDWNVRRAIVGAIGTICESRSDCYLGPHDASAEKSTTVSIFSRRYEKEHCKVKKTMMRVLGEIAEPSCVGTLLKATYDSEAEVRDRANLALQGHYCDHSVVKELILAREVRRAVKSDDWKTSHAAFEALYNLRKYTGIWALDNVVLSLENTLERGYNLLFGYKAYDHSGLMNIIKKARIFLHNVAMPLREYGV